MNSVKLENSIINTVLYHFPFIYNRTRSVSYKNQPKYLSNKGSFYRLLGILFFFLIQLWEIELAKKGCGSFSGESWESEYVRPV